MGTKRTQTVIGVVAIVLLGIFLYFVLAGKSASAPVGAPPAGGAGSGANVVGPGAHCGGFIRNAPQCAPGLHCQIDTTRPDTGGTCVADAATSTSSAGGIAPFHSGVRGVVLQGPTCPVVQNPPSKACADKPYQTAVIVSRAGSSHTFASQRADATGAFTFSLPPGDYTVSAASGSPLPRCTPVHVTVPATGYASTTISCDTGIR